MHGLLLGHEQSRIPLHLLLNQTPYDLQFSLVDGSLGGANLEDGFVILAVLPRAVRAGLPSSSNTRFTNLLGNEPREDNPMQEPESDLVRVPKVHVKQDLMIPDISGDLGGPLDGLQEGFPQLGLLPAARDVKPTAMDALLELKKRREFDKVALLREAVCAETLVDGTLGPAFDTETAHSTTIWA